MNTPPPLPKNPKTGAKEGIKRAVFTERKTFSLGNTTFDYGLIEAAHQKAEAWMNENPHIEIVQIETFPATTMAITVVWYRD